MIEPHIPRPPDVYDFAQLAADDIQNVSRAKLLADYPDGWGKDAAERGWHPQLVPFYGTEPAPVPLPSLGNPDNVSIHRLRYDNVTGSVRHDAGRDGSVLDHDVICLAVKLHDRFGGAVAAPGDELDTNYPGDYEVIVGREMPTIAVRYADLDHREGYLTYDVLQSPKAHVLTAMDCTALFAQAVKNIDRVGHFY